MEVLEMKDAASHLGCKRLLRSKLSQVGLQVGFYRLPTIIEKTWIVQIASPG